MNNLNHIDQQVEQALASVTLSQDAKYRVKNRIHSASSHVQKHTGRKLSSAAVIAVTLVSLLVITGAAIGISMFNSIYGEKADVLTPYGITIGTSAQNNNVVLTLHESVADDYATAYIFSVRGLTDTGKALVMNNTLGLSGYQTKFKQQNISQGEFLPEITNCKIYCVSQQTATGDFVDLNIGLRCDGMQYNVVDNASYVIIPIESLREENCEYYALYAITPETHQFTLTFDGLELPLPEATTHIPGVEIQIEGYIQDYFLTEEVKFKKMSDYPVSAVLTPLGLYVNDKHAGSMPVMYRNAVLVFSDGSEKELSEIAIDKAGVVSWNTSYFPTYQGAVYLFNEIMDVSTVKSLLFYGEIEFPFDGSASFVRSSGRTLNPNNPKFLIWNIANQIHDYVIEVCPDPWTVIDPNTNKSVQETGWSDVKYYTYYILHFGRTVNNNDFDFYISYTNSKGGTLEDEVKTLTKLVNLNVLARGTYEDMEVLAIEQNVGYSDYKRCIYALYKGNLWTIEYRAAPDLPNDYAFDALLDLIK